MPTKTVTSFEKDELTTQIVDLQTRASFQEDSLAQLDDVIRRQDQEILLLKAQIERLVQRVADMQFAMEDNEAPMASEKPPHY